MKWACLAACVLAYGLIEASWAEDTQSQSQDRGQSKRAWLLKKFDANGDGKLDSQERETARKAKILKKFDANGDGTLDQTEKKAAREARQEFQQKKWESATGSKENA
jgi:hypothetical protein